MSDWDEIIGLQQIKDKMKAAAEGGQCSHAYLITGERKSGKSMLAKCFAKALQCEGEGHRPCGMCLSCLQLEEGSHPDVVFLEHAKPETISVAEVRQGVGEDILLKPYRSARKIYIIDDADKMTVAAQNALLKTLEEPPSYGVILLTANSTESLLPTIISRTVVLPIRPLPDETVRKYLMNRMHVPDYRADVLTAFARGNLGRAKELAGGKEFEERKELAVTILKGIDDADLGKVYNRAVELGKKAKEDRSVLTELFDLFLLWSRDALCYKSTGRTEGLIFREEIQYIKKVAKEISYEGFEQIFRALSEAKKELRYNVRAETAVNLLLIGMKDASKER